MKRCCQERQIFYLTIIKIADTMHGMEISQMTDKEKAITDLLVEKRIGNYHNERYMNL